MNVDLLSTIFSGIVSLVAGVASGYAVQQLIRRKSGIRGEKQKPYSERLAELTTSLNKASREVDSVLAELAQVISSRESSVQKIEADLSSLERKEKETKERITALEQTPLPAADHFAKLLEVREKRNAKRDYLLFGAGVIVTTIVALVIQILVG